MAGAAWHCLDTGDSEMAFTAALHTYYKVASIDSVKVQGLDGVAYTDSLQGGKKLEQSGDVVFDQEVDRIYLAVPDSGVKVRQRPLHPTSHT